MKLLALGVILGALAGLWVIAKSRWVYADHLEFDEFRERFDRLPDPAGVGSRRRF